MDIIQSGFKYSGIKFVIENDNGENVRRAFLYIMHNELHKQPFGLMEDVFVEVSARGNGFGKALVKKVISAAKHRSCYKLIACSRYKRSNVHKLYRLLGFHDHGKEFRIDF